MRRVRAAVSAFAMLAATSVLLADPAVACSCAGHRGIDDAALANGGSIAILTRTDPGNGANGDDDLDATFTVHHALGGALPPEMTAAVGDGGSCTPYIAPGQVAAVSISRRGAGYELTGCGDIDLGTALQRALGDPRPITGGPVVAYAAGAFGGSRLVALDAEGRPVAWDTAGGAGTTVAVCPDGRTVVTTGRTEAAKPTDTVEELTVHDAATLKQRRVVELPLGDYGRVHAVRCADPEGSRVEILAVDSENEHPEAGELLIVENATVRSVDLGTLVQGAATADGFVAVTGEKPQAITRITPDGARTELADLGDAGVDAAQLVMSPDGRTIAVFGEGSGDNPLRTFDAATGRRLGQWTTEDTYVTGLAWTASNRLLVRHESEYRQAPVPLRVFDRELREEQPWAGVTGEWGGTLVAVGEAAVTAGGTPLTATTEAGSRLIAADLRLAAAKALVPATAEAAFAAGTAPPADGLAGQPGALFDEDGSSSHRGIWLLAAVAALLGAALGTRRWLSRC